MEGDPDFEGLVDRHYGALYRFALSLARTESDACDLVQETFLAWAEKARPLLDPSKARAWLFTTLHREHLQRQRRRTRFPELEIEETDLPLVEPALVERLDGEAAVALLGQVEEPFRAALALFYLEDCSHPEIAAILEIPLGTVKSRLARGLAQLRRLVLEAPRP